MRKLRSAALQGQSSFTAGACAGSIQVMGSTKAQPQVHL